VTQIGIHTFVPHYTVTEREAVGRTARQRVPRTRQGQWLVPADRPDPIELLLGQEVSRVPLAACDNSYGHVIARSAARDAAAQYCQSMAQSASMNEIDIWYDRIDASCMEQWARTNTKQFNLKAMQKSFDRAQQRTMWTAVSKSVLEPYTDVADYSNQGQRVVEGQRIIQAAIADFSLTYADLVAHDFELFQEAVASGRPVGGSASEQMDDYLEAFRNPAAYPVQ